MCLSEMRNGRFPDTVLYGCSYACTERCRLATWLPEFWMLMSGLLSEDCHIECLHFKIYHCNDYLLALPFSPSWVPPCTGSFSTPWHCPHHGCFYYLGHHNDNGLNVCFLVWCSANINHTSFPLLERCCLPKRDPTFQKAVSCFFYGCACHCFSLALSLQRSSIQ